MCFLIICFNCSPFCCVHFQCAIYLMTITIVYRPHLPMATAMIPPHRIASATTIPTTRRIPRCVDSSRPFWAVTFHTAVEAMSSPRPSARNTHHQPPPPRSSISHRRSLQRQMPQPHRHQPLKRHPKMTPSFRPSNASASHPRLHHRLRHPNPGPHPHRSSPPLRPQSIAVP